MKEVKTDDRNSLTAENLSNQLRIYINGSDIRDFETTPAILHFLEGKTRRPDKRKTGDCMLRTDDDVVQILY